MTAVQRLIATPQTLLILWYGLMSLLLFLAMGDDKRRAQAGRRRTPEARLFLLAALGGALGGWLGMRAFRHKTRHWTFVLGFPLLSLLQLGFLIYLIIR